MKKLIRIFYSMKFAILILVLMILLSVVGSLIPQNEPANFYLSKYGEGPGQVLVQLGFDDIFHSVWYFVLTLLLCISLFICVLIRIKRLKRAYSLEDKSHFYRLFGSWLLHLGIFLIILFYALGNMNTFESNVYNIAGTKTEIEGTDLTLAIDDFDILLREDDSVESYVSKVRVFEGDQLLKEGEIKVNQPMTVKGYQISQASFGYAVRARVSRFDEEIGTATLFQDEVVSADSGKFIVEMINLFPDFVEVDGGYATKSPHMNNPKVLVNLYYMEQLVGRELMDLNQVVEVGEYKVSLDQPDHYTLLAVRKDPYSTAVGVSALVMVAGVMLTFFGPKSKQEGLEDE